MYFALASPHLGLLLLVLAVVFSSLTTLSERCCCEACDKHYPNLSWNIFNATVNSHCW
ncbi:hypothetical protein P692DRAFT_2081459 [Suillus brevipes Sb2]|nr:hypothetical protein P692DRAFT_2081459 [Suillus brevipes Sb2]